MSTEPATAGEDMYDCEVMASEDGEEFVIAEICRDDRVRERIQAEVDRVNEEFESYEKIKQFRLVEEEFTEANDLLTPTMKKKRRNILDRFADEVELIYDDG